MQVQVRGHNMEYTDLKKLARIAISADKNKPVAYSFGNEQFSCEQVNQALREELDKLAGGHGRNFDYRTYKENQNTIFRLIEETITEVLPQQVLDRYMDFAEVRRVGQGEKAIFRSRISEYARQRAKSFVTRVGLAGRYEVFMLDGAEYEVGTAAIGGACRIGFEEFLDGRIQFSELTEILMEGMNEYIYKEIAKALAKMATDIPEVQRASAGSFDEKTMDELLAIADSYGHAAIYCTLEFAAKMVPADSWISSDMKNAMWDTGYLANYKGHQVIILPQSMEDVSNKQKVIDPAYAYIIPVGSEKPVKLVFEGSTQVREVEDNDDWSHDLQTYMKFGIATIASNWMCVYQNTELKKDTRPQD